MLFANLRFIKAINKMAKVKSVLNNIGVIKICSHMGTTLHKRLKTLKTPMEECSQSKTPPWVSFTFFKWYKWYQIAKNITYK